MENMNIQIPEAKHIVSMIKERKREGRKERKLVGFLIMKLYNSKDKEKS